LDSLTSSLLYAYIRSQTSPPSTYGSLYIPITNIPAADIQLRPEFLSLLPHAHLQPQSLITLDDLATDSTSGGRLDAENTRWILVDHNALQGALGARYGNSVVGVIDHHDEENVVPMDTGGEPRIIEKSGSCASLVVEYLKDEWDILSTLDTGTDQNRQELDNHIARLALAAILIDTHNLSDKTKTTTHDTNAVEYLKTKLQDVETNDMFTQISTAKQDIGTLALHDILRKDYKEWDVAGWKLGIASAVKPISFLNTKALTEDKEAETSSALAKAIAAFAQSRNLSLFALGTACAPEGKFQRELLIAALTPAAAPLAEAFELQAGSELQLQPWTGDPISNTTPPLPLFKIYNQLATQHSRKRIAPLLRDAMTG